MTHCKPREEHRLQTENRLALLRLGYLRPLSLSEKRPWEPGWNTNPITEATIKALPAYAYRDIHRPALTTGIQPATDGHNIVFVDSDVGDPDTAPEIARIAAQVFGEVAYTEMPYRHSGRSTFALLARSDTKIPYYATDAFTAGDGSVQRVEMFGEGASKQMGCLGAHTYQTRENGKLVMSEGRMIVSRSYQWTNRSPLEVAPGDLPLVSTAALTDFLRECSALMESRPGYTKVARPEGWVEGVTELFTLNDDTIFDVKGRGKMSYPDLLFLIKEHGEQRCSMSFTHEAHDNTSKAIASLLVWGGEIQIKVYDFETSITHKRESISPDYIAKLLRVLRRRGNRHE